MGKGDNFRLAFRVAVFALNYIGMWAFYAWGAISWLDGSHALAAGLVAMAMATSARIRLMLHIERMHDGKG